LIRASTTKESPPKNTLRYDPRKGRVRHHNKTQQINIISKNIYNNNKITPKIIKKRSSQKLRTERKIISAHTTSFKNYKFKYNKNTSEKINIELYLSTSRL